MRKKQAKLNYLWPEIEKTLPPAVIDTYYLEI